MALLGWNDGTEKELFSLDELVNAFDLNRIHKAGAKFDPEKNKWFNHQYLQRQDNRVLAETFYKELTAKGLDCPLEKVEKIVGLIKERAHFVAEFWSLSDYFFEAPTAYDEKAAKNWKEDTADLLQQLIMVLDGIADFSSLQIENTVKEWMTTHEIGMGRIMQPFRLSLVGALKGPHLFDIAELISKTETIARLQKAIQTL